MRNNKTHRAQQNHAVAVSLVQQAKQHLTEAAKLADEAKQEHLDAINLHTTEALTAGKHADKARELHGKLRGL